MEQNSLLKIIKSFGQSTAMVFSDHNYSYEQLVERVDDYIQELEKLAIAPGEVVALSSDYSFEACALLIGLITNRNIIVPLASINTSDQEKYHSIATVQHVFTFTNENQSLPYAYKNLKNQHSTHPLIQRIVQQDTPGLILFTSGSTGDSKASVHDINKMLKKHINKQSAKNKLTTLTFLLLDHIGGINTLFYTLLNGGTIVTCNQRNANTIGKLIQTHKVELLPTTPTFLNMLLISEIYEKYDLSSLKLITYGTEPMPESTLLSLSQVFPDVKIKQTYGLSELGIMKTISENSGSPWMKIVDNQYDIKIVDGCLWIKSTFSMLGYLNAKPPFDQEGWFNTNDKVELKGEFMRILGRESEIINVGGEKVFPSEVENVVRQIKNIKDVIVEGKKNPITGHIVTAKISLFASEDKDNVEMRIREFCKKKLAPYKIPAYFKITEDDLHNSRFKKVRHAS